MMTELHLSIIHHSKTPLSCFGVRARKRRVTILARRVAAALLLAILLACGNTGDPGPIPEPAQRGTLRIVDLNVWSGLDYRGTVTMGEYESAEMRRQRYAALLAQIRTLQADIIGLHEVNKLPDYAEKLANDIGYDVFYHVGVGGVRVGPVGLPWNLREGDAILTRPQLQAEFAGRKQLSGGHVGNFFTFHFTDATQIIGVRVLNKGQPLYVFATHWHASLLDTPEIRQRARARLEAGSATQAEYREVREDISAGQQWRLDEASATIAFIRETAGGHPFVLMGDFNATEDSEEIKLIKQELGAVDAFRFCNPDSAGFTWRPQRNLNIEMHYLTPLKSVRRLDLAGELKKIHQATPKRIDYIFMGPQSVLAERQIQITSSAVVFDEIINGVHASDHFGVAAELVFAREGGMEDGR